MNGNKFVYMENKINETKKIFFRFLKSNRVFYKYFRYFKKRKDNDFDVFLKNRNSHGLFVAAFVWCETDEGHNFWRELDNEWQKQLNEKNK